jgi:hypothetical protein
MGELTLPHFFLFSLLVDAIGQRNFTPAISSLGFPTVTNKGSSNSPFYVWIFPKEVSVALKFSTITILFIVQEQGGTRRKSQPFPLPKFIRFLVKWDNFD